MAIIRVDSMGLSATLMPALAPSMLKNIKLVQYFGGIIAVFWVSFSALAIFAWLGLGSAADSLHEVHDNRMHKAEQLSQMADQATRNRMEILLMFQHDPAGPLAGIHDHATELHLDNFAKRREESDRLWASVLKGDHDEAEQALLKQIEGARGDWRAKSNAAIQAIRESRFTPEIMASYLVAGRTEGEAMLKSLAALNDHQQIAAKEAADSADKRYHMATVAFLVMVLALGTPASLLALYVLRRMRQGFAQADESTKAIAAGDLTHSSYTDGNDEIAQLLNHMELMRVNLIRVLSEVLQSADSIQVASSEVAAGNADLSHRTEQTASNLQQTASSTEELGVTVRQNADNAHQANQLAQGASEVASRGGVVVAEVVDTMKGINDSSRRIADIIGVIDGIAFQTNILALNAAVEAARAGEQGRGFAVVAGEVRSLAQRSAEAAREIRTLIAASVERVEAGSRQVDHAGATMSEVVQAISRVRDIVGEISQASVEQSEGVSLVGQAVSQMDAATQQNAALVEQSAAAAESLSNQASHLVRTVSGFKMNEADQRKMQQVR